MRGIWKGLIGLAIFLLFFIPFVAAPCNEIETVVLRNIDIPNFTKGQTISAIITLKNALYPSNEQPQGNLIIIVRKRDGTILNGYPLPIYNVSIPWYQPFLIYPFVIENASNPTVLKAGETYTISVKFIESSCGPDYLGEQIVKNNVASKTFTILPGFQTVPIDDSPWWMSAGMLSIVLGWLYFSTQGKSKRGKFSQ